MSQCHEIAREKNISAQLEVISNFEERQRSRWQAKTTCEKPLAWFLPRGYLMADGDLLRAEDGTLIRVIAAQEPVSEINSEQTQLLMRAAYHLGNRHVPLQIGLHFLRYQPDHVLDAMVEGLGLQVIRTDKPFHPENGAYHAHSHDRPLRPPAHAPLQLSKDIGIFKAGNEQ